MPWLPVCVPVCPGTHFRSRTIKDHDGSCTFAAGSFAEVTRNTPVQFDMIATITDQQAAIKNEDGANMDIDDKNAANTRSMPERQGANKQFHGLNTVN
ncbi:hypothetical protein DPMN_024720 [Dreissena polymorpha]|uniref:Uncharacterized protein n=1 Tax=Dreissena polymorpha TaxID=45954 RepID=A0A9D4LMZ4_DREPO|nr:hypothetical protein DPMN_024720 [Dreissena polymorpha]